jgi:tryptophan 6-halogenase
MGKPISNIAIVGAGSSGWIVAAYLNHRLQWGVTANRPVTITLIESPDVGTIGVGEATVPTLKGTLQLLEISEAEFMRRTDATFKLGIWFKGWNRAPDGRPYTYMHPFTGGMTCLGFNPGYSFKRYGLPDRPGASDRDFLRTISHALDASEDQRGPRAFNGPEYGGALQYAYHIDAAKLADFLAELCVVRGVTHLRDNVTGVDLDERGFIRALRLERTGEFPVELVIDCTGFHGFLIHKTLNEPYISYADYLFNDRAIPIQVAHEDRERIDSVTSCTALEAGWSWNIPLQSRVGTGYVYSSRFKTDDEALDEFRRFLGPAVAASSPRVVRFRIGRSERSWVRNCVAIGLSSGFVEPLESTAIMSVEMMARWLLHSLPTLDFEPSLIDRFNTRAAQLYEEIRDFLGLHYSLSNRDDMPYWRAVRHEAKLSDTLAEHLALWRHSLPSPVDQRPARIFNAWSVACVLMGKDYYRGAELTGEEMVPPHIWEQYCREIAQARQAIMGRIANHKRLVDYVVVQAVPGGSALRKRRPGASVLESGEALTVAPAPILEARA